MVYPSKPQGEVEEKKKEGGGEKTKER